MYYGWVDDATRAAVTATAVAKNFYYWLCHHHSILYIIKYSVPKHTNRLQIVFIELYSISITEMQTTNGINSQLSITHSDRQDSGVYKCVAENPFGKSEHVIYVAVQGMY